VLVAVSNKKFLGEVLDADKDHRLEATLAATALCAWQGGRVFRAHQVAATRRVLDTVGAVRGSQPPRVSRRALA
jgi:dihydropteroate synthase